MISQKDVQHIAKLARIGLTPKEVGKFQKELSAILDFFKELKKIDTSKIEPCSHPFFLENIMRQDQDIREVISDKLIEAAPVIKGRHVKVKPIL